MENGGRGVIFRLSNGQFFVANGGAISMWRDIAAGRSAAEIQCRLEKEYGIPSSVARADVCEFLSELVQRKLMQRRRPIRTQPGRVIACLAALIELLRYDLEMALGGFGRIQAGLQRHPVRWCVDPEGVEATLGAAAALACSLYWKPPRCLQRSVMLVRLLRRAGIAAELVIGYRPNPFFSHAWVEVGGRVLNDSPAYARRLAVLHRA